MYLVDHPVRGVIIIIGVWLALVSGLMWGLVAIKDNVFVSRECLVMEGRWVESRYGWIKQNKCLEMKRK